MIISGPALIIRRMRNDLKNNSLENVEVSVLALVVLLFFVDALMNGMLNPVYVVIAGALMCIAQKENWQKRFDES